MPLLTPGLAFLANALTFLSLPVFGASAARYVLLKYMDVTMPTWSVVVVSVFALPVYGVTRVMLSESRQRREAAALGARLVPRAKGKWIGNLDMLKMMMDNLKNGYPGDGIWEIMQEEGPVFNMRVLWDDSIFTSSPEHIQLILATDFSNYVKGERFQKNMSGMLGVGVFNSDGDMWKFHRSMTRPFFSRDRITHFDLFDRHADAAMALMKQRLRAGYPVDFQDLMGRFTLDSATEFLFGSCVHSLSAGLPFPYNVASPSGASTPTGRGLDTLLLTNMSATKRAQQFTEAFLDAQEVISRRERLGWTWPLTEVFEDKIKRPMTVVNAFVEPIIKEAVLKKKQNKSYGPEKTAQVNDIDDDETLLDHLVKITDDPVVLKDATLNIMIAGRDTTAATLTFIMYFLCIYPNVMARLREEILAKVGPTKRPSYDDVKEMKYLRAVINETLRLYPVVPFNVRESINATTWPSPDPAQPPLYIPAGSKMPYSVFLMHRRTDLWGPDAEVFDPDRFLDDRLKTYLAPKPFIFLPFNAGPRICLGQQFAYNEMSFMLVRLMQNFSSFTFDSSACPPEFRPPASWTTEPGRKGVEKIFPKMTLTMYTGGGLWVKAQEAEAA